MLILYFVHISNFPGPRPSGPGILPSIVSQDGNQVNQLASRRMLPADPRLHQIIGRAATA